MTPSSLISRDVLGAPIVVARDGSLPVVGFRIAFRGGVAVEPRGRSGVTSHLMELMLRGTRSKSRRELWEQMEKLGTSIWLAVSKELAVLGGMCLARNTSAVMELVREVLTDPAFLPEEHERLITETVENIRSERDDDEGFLHECLRAGLYGDHPMKHSVLGTVEDVEALTVSALREARARRVTPANSVLGFSGDISAAQAEAHALAVLKDLPRGPEVALPEQPAGPDGFEIVIGHKPNRAQVQMALAHPGLSGSDPDALAMWLGVIAFGGMFTSRLNREIRDDRGWSYATEATYSYRRLMPSPVTLYAAPGVNDAVPCFELCAQLYCDFAQGLVDDAGIRMARDYTINRFPLDHVTCHDYLGPGLLAAAGGVSMESVTDVPRRLEVLKPEKVREVLSQNLSPNRCVAALVGDAEKLRPALEGQFPDASVRVIDYRENPNNS